MSRNYWDVCESEDEVKKLLEIDYVLTKFNLWTWLKNFDIENTKDPDGFINSNYIILKVSLTYGNNALIFHNNLSTMKYISLGLWEECRSFHLGGKMFRQTDEYKHLRSLQEIHKENNEVSRAISNRIMERIEDMQKQLKIKN